MKNSAGLHRPPGVVIRPVGLRTLLRDPDRCPHPIGTWCEADKFAPGCRVSADRPRKRGLV